MSGQTVMAVHHYGTYSFLVTPTSSCCTSASVCFILPS